jgi:hypothetical protein
MLNNFKQIFDEIPSENVALAVATVRPSGLKLFGRGIATKEIKRSY